MLIDISRSIKTLKGSREYGNINSVLIQMREDIHKKFDSTKLQNLSGLSRTAFFSRFKETTGVPPAEYFQKLKVESSKGLLTDTVKSIKEIAYDLGFHDPYHFSRVFKESTGMAPGLFRKKGDNINQKSVK